MQQPKQSKGKETKEVIGIGKNKKRADLSKEFQEFKQRIQEFENKNEEIISRIRDAYTVKKKAIQQPEYPSASNPHISNTYYASNPQVYYQNNDGQSVASSCDYSKDVVFEGAMAKHSSGRPVRSIYNSNAEEAEILRQNQSTQQLPTTHSVRGHYQGTYDDYIRSQNNRLRTEEDRTPNSPDPTFSGRFGTAQQHSQLQEERLQMEEQYRLVMQRSHQLEEALQDKEEELTRAKGNEGKLKSSVAILRRMFEDGLENFQEEVIGERFLEMEKYLRRCELRLKNLTFRLKDSIEERRARKIIGRSRSKRNSISKPRNKESSLSEEAQSTPKVSRAYSQSKGRRSENPAKHKEFEQIAVDYENMIKAKTSEVETLEKRLSVQMKAKEAVNNELLKAKVSLEEKQRELVELRKKKQVKEKDENEGKDLKELKELKEKLNKAEEEVRARQAREKELTQTITRLEKAKKTMHEEYSQSLSKNKSLKQKAVQQLEGRLRQAEASAGKEGSELRDRIAGMQKRMMEKECEMLALLNKLKKIQNENQIKEEKLRELEGLLLKDNDHADLLDRSVSVDTSMLSHTEVRHLQETLRRMDEEIEEKKALIYDLQKEKYLFENSKREMEAQATVQAKTNATLEQRVSQLRRQLQNYQLQDGKELQRELDAKQEFIEELEGEKQLLLEEKEELAIRNGQLMEDLKKAKENNLTANRELIKINSQLTFTRNEQSSLQAKLLKAKEEACGLKSKLEEMQVGVRERERQLEEENAQLRQEVENLKNHILQAETIGNRNPLDKEDDILLNSLHVSDISFNYRPKFNTEEQAAVLREKLREVQAALEIKTGMQEEVQAEYRSNLERLRTDSAEKQRELEETRSQLQHCRAELEKLRGARQEEQSFEKLKVEVYEQKIMQMEEEYAALKESEERLNEMLHQILQTIKQREEEKEKLLKEAEDKDRLLEELRELLELKETRFDPTKTNRSDTLRDFSLRVSGDHSEELIDANELSYLSNISDVFKHDDLLQERIRRGRTGREEQAKLFARTAAYIKSLKAIIEGKEKRVKTLEKQLTAMRTQEGRSWSDRDKERSNSDRPYLTEQAEEVDEVDEFKDYDSVQLDTRRSKYTQLVKVLQHEKNLAVQENKLLSKQIQALQDELQRSEEQQNSLVRIKDLYKDEIKKLIQKNEAHTKEFETQIHKLKQQLQASDSFHNLEAIKQLFLKMIPAIAFLDDPTAKAARRDEKRKELQEYVKVMSSILQLDAGTRDRLLATLRK